MLKYGCLLLPGHELDGFPRQLESDHAACLLAGFTALWHPQIVYAIQGAPGWQQAENSPTELDGLLAIQTPLTRDKLHADFGKANAEGRCVLLDALADWRDLQAQILTQVGLPPLDSERAELVEALRAPFAALGYAYLQVQLLTRQMRYTSNLDQSLFNEQVALAADAVMAGDSQKAEEQLQSCFDALGQERDHYYSLDVNLIDVTLLADSTLGKSLTRQLDSQASTNYLACAALLQKLQREQPASFEKLRLKTESSAACIVGGLDVERPHPLMTRENVIRDLYHGRLAYEKLGIAQPKIFGRMSFGVFADEAVELKRFGFEGVLLTAWSEGAYPDGNQAKLSWEASDGTHIPALSATVLDAADPASFLAFGWDVGESLDNQHVPTLLFAHWPSRTCDFFELLQIVASRTPALGKWRMAHDYFATTDQPYHQERLSPSSFKYNWLASVESPSQWIEATKQMHILDARCRSLQNLSNLVWQLEHPPKKRSSDDENTEEQAAAAVRALAVADWQPDLSRLQAITDSLLDEPGQAKTLATQAFELAEQLASVIVERLQALLTGASAAAQDASGKGPAQKSQAQGRLIVNPRSCPTRMRVQSDRGRVFPEADWNFASGPVGHDTYTCIDVPSAGFVVAPLLADAGKAKKKAVLADAGGQLRNEFLEAQIDMRRGSLRSLHVPARRGNRLSMVVGRREKTEGKSSYSDMQATDVRMLTSSSMCGLIRAKGKLVLDGQKTGEFEIDYEVWKGSRVLEIAIRLSHLKSLSQSNPWLSAYVARLAWPTEAAILRSYSGGRRHSWPSGRTISPNLIEIDEADYRTHFLPGGLAFHRRTEMRFLESILAASNEDVEHRIGIGVDLPFPLLGAADFLDSRYSKLVTGTSEVVANQGWLLTSDVKNVMVDLESPLVDTAGRTVGVRLFLSECEGKSTSTRVRLMHNVAMASRVDYLGNHIGKLTVQDDSLTIAMRANEQCNIDVIWQ